MNKKYLESKARKVKEIRCKIRWEVLSGLDFKISKKDYDYYEKNKYILED